MNSTGKVYLIGAGPGDPRLLTLRGQQCLRQADVVLYDYLAGVGTLEWTRPDAELYCLGRHGAGKLWTQAEISNRMVQEALRGKVVARLKGGDPNIFGRLAEELHALGDAGVAFEVVPGVSAGVAAGAYAGVTVTDRERASCVTFLTGHEQPGKDASSLDYSALASVPGTLVVYMGVTTAQQWSAALMQHGKPAETPVMLVRRCSLPDQQTFQCTLGEVSDVLAPGKIRPPVVAIVGAVAQRADYADWFMGRPLFGKTVLVTRPRRQAGAMVDRFTDLGAQTLVQPAIKVGVSPEPDRLSDAIHKAGGYNWVVFSSSNGVEAFFQALQDAGYDARHLGGVRVAAIGPATADALAECRIKVDVSPPTYRAEALAEALAHDASGKRFLLVRASRGRETLAEMLQEAGGVVEQVVAYESRDVEVADPDTSAMLEEGRIDWVTVTSSAIARSLVKLFGERLRRTRLAAISPLTASVLTELGYEADAVATDYTAEGVVQAILAVQSSR